MEGSGQEEWSEGAQQQPQQQPQRQPPQQHRQPHGGPVQKDLKDILGKVLLIGVIIILVGALMISISGFIDPTPEDPEDVEDARDNIRYLRAIGVLLITIGVFIPGVASSYFLFSKRGLSEKEKLMLVIIVAISILGLAILVSSPQVPMIY